MGNLRGRRCHQLIIRVLILTVCCAFNKVGGTVLAKRFHKHMQTFPGSNPNLTAYMSRNRCADWCLSVPDCLAFSIRMEALFLQCSIYPKNVSDRGLRLYPSTEWITFVEGMDIGMFIRLKAMSVIWSSGPFY